MGRLKGGLIESVFDVTKRAPLDARELVTKYEDLINPSIWYVAGTTVETLYDGLTVSVREVGPHMGKYFLTDRKAVTQENYNNYKIALENGDDTSIYFAMWEKLATEDFVLKTIGLPSTEQNVTIYELL
jgi:secreted protein with Ig-like and vWFA domain